VTAPAHRPFDLAGQLPTGSMAIEASAGTGKTYTLAGLATRYIAEGGVPPSELLIVTFTRAATGELRARVRDRMVEAAACLDGTGRPPAEDDVLLLHLARGNVPLLLERLRRAITEFDAATITTIHGFATQVRQTLGATVGIDPDTRLVDDAKELVDEVCADVLAAASLEAVEAGVLPALDKLCAATRVAAGQSDLRLEPSGEDQGALPEQVLMTRLVGESVDRLDRRRRSRGSVSFDDVLVQLRDVLRGPAAAAVVETLRNRFKVALIDEFQDTDRVQWDIFSTLFGTEGSGTTLVLVGDPKQAIYRFRGADIGAYLGAVDRAGTERRSLATNWRSDGAVLTALEALLDGATFGADSIDFVPVEPAPANRERRLRTGAGGELPTLVVRLATGSRIARNKNRAQVATEAAGHAIDRDLVAYVHNLLETAVLPSTKDETGPRPVRPSDIAVLVRTGAQGDAVQTALRGEGIPAVVATSGNVLESPSAVQMRYLLHAMGRPSDARAVRTYALSWFVGWSADEIATASDDALVPLQEQLADWAALLSGHAVADVLARVWADTGVVARVLGAPDGDRNLTDLDHLAELLHGAVPHGMASVAGLLAVLDAEPENDADSEAEGDVAARRIESEADAVQIMTIWKAKGLEFPVVCVPTLWRFGTTQRESLIYTDPDSGVRTCDLTVGEPWPDEQSASRRKALADEEVAGERLRLLYVALTRAQHQTVVWWANASSSGKTAVAHVLFARSEGTIDPDAFARATVSVPADDDIVDTLTPLVERAPGTIEVVPIDDRPASPVRWEDSDTDREPPGLELARFETVLDRSVHRWSFSSMTQQAASSAFDPYDPSLADGGAHDEQQDEEDVRPELEVAADSADAGASPPAGAPPPGPLAPLPAGAAFGTMIHAVLEKVDFATSSLDEELGDALDEELSWRGLDLTPTDPGALNGADGARLVVEGLRAAIETPLGALFSGRRLADLAEGDRLNEVSFDLRLGQAGPPARVDDIGRLVASHLEPSDPLAPWAAALAGGAIDVELAGYLTGSIDLVARVRNEDGGVRFVVADYKTNQLTRRGVVPLPDDYGPERLTGAMIEHHYPLQALLYAVALHRYLRWRQPDYRAETHLGGASYLFVRGMTGPGVATTDGRPHGVFNWAMVPGMVVGLSELLDGRRPVAA
jgi:exodeoxyribonuclease V beta subunit